MSGYTASPKDTRLCFTQPEVAQSKSKIKDFFGSCFNSNHSLRWPLHKFCRSTNSLRAAINEARQHADQWFLRGARVKLKRYFYFITQPGGNKCIYFALCNNARFKIFEKNSPALVEGSLLLLSPRISEVGRPWRLESNVPPLSYVTQI